MKNIDELLATDIENLEKVLGACRAIESRDDIPMEFIWQLQDVSHNYMAIKNAQVQTVIVDSWLFYFENCVATTKVPEQNQNEFDTFIKYLLTHNLVKTVAQQSDNARILANICTQRVSAACRGRPPHEEYNVNVLLTEWTGLDTKATTHRSLQETVELLYGPAAWTFYGDEPSYNLAGVLWSQHVPLNPKMTGSSKLVSIELPMDVSDV